MGKKDKKKESLYEEFSRMSAYVTEGMDKNPRNDREFAQQAGKAYGRSLVFSIWFVAKAFKFVFKLSRRLLSMVFGRGKKKEDPAFVSPALEQQMRAFQQMQQQQMGYPQQPQMGGGIPQEFPAGYPAMPPQPPMQSLPQPPFRAPPAPPMQQMQPMPPLQRPQQYSGAIMPPNSLFEQLMQSFIALTDKFRECDLRLTTHEQALNDIYDRLNMLQGVQPQPSKRIKFEKGK